MKEYCIRGIYGTASDVDRTVLKSSSVKLNRWLLPLSPLPEPSVPLSSVHLSSVPLSSVHLSSVPLSSVPLSSVHLSSALLSSVSLSSVPQSLCLLFLCLPSLCPQALCLPSLCHHSPCLPFPVLSLSLPSLCLLIVLSLCRGTLTCSYSGVSTCLYGRACLGIVVFRCTRCARKGS
jgi:hypothetical protein